MLSSRCSGGGWAAIRGCRSAVHNAAQSGLGGCARLLARSEVASWLPRLLAALVVLLWATYPTWFYTGLGAAAAPGYGLSWALVYISTKMAFFGVRWWVGRPRYRPSWRDVRRPLFWGGGFLFMTNAGLFNLSLSALGGGGAVLLLESWAITAAALLAVATGRARRLRSVRLLGPYGLLLTGLALGAWSVGGGFPSGRDLAIALLGHICAAASIWGSVWAMRVCAQVPAHTYSATLFWMAGSGVTSLAATVVMGRLAGVSASLGVEFPLAGWVTAVGAGLVTGLGDLLYRRALRIGDGVALHGLFLLLPAVSVGWLAVVGGAGVGLWELFLPGLALVVMGNLLQWRLAEARQ